MSELPTSRRNSQLVRALPWLLGLIALLVLVGGVWVVRTLLAENAPRLFVASLNDVVVADEWSVTISEVLRAESVEANEEALPAEAQWLLVYGEVRNFSGEDVILLPEQFLLEGSSLPASLIPDEGATRLAAVDVAATDYITDGDGLLVPPAETVPFVLAYAVPDGAEQLALQIVPAQTAVELGALAEVASLNPEPESGTEGTAAESSDTASDTTTTDSAENPLRVPARVLDVLDGESIRVEVEGETEEVRLIGIVAPDDQTFARQAREAHQQLVEGKEVLLERDLRDRDSEGRLLRYVWVGEEMVNGALVEQGLALVTTFPPNVKYRTELLQLEQAARAAKRGLWAENPGGIVAPRRTATARPRTPTRPAATATRPASTQPPAATATQRPAPAATVTQPPAATATQPPAPAATATQPPVPTRDTAARAPPRRSHLPPPRHSRPPPPRHSRPQPTATQPPAPTATQPPAATATQPPAPTAHATARADCDATARADRDATAHANRDATARADCHAAARAHGHSCSRHTGATHPNPIKAHLYGLNHLT